MEKNLVVRNNGLIAVTALAAAVSLMVGGGCGSSARAQGHVGAAAHAAPGPRVAASPAISQVAAGLGSDGSIADVAARVSPTVVKLSSSRVRSTGLENGAGDLFDNPLFRQFFGGRVPETPRGPDVERGVGSGVIISPDGYILTNNHIVEDATALQVELSDGRRFQAQVVGTDAPSDLALLHIDATGLPALTLGDSSTTRVGEIVLAIGNPFGVGQTVTMGIVSAMGRDNMGINDYEDFIQTDASINPGNSGGALVNLRGELIGINTAILSRTGASAGVGFAIPSNMARGIADALRAHGHVVRGWLGVGIQDMTAELARGLGVADDTHGALVSEVSPDTPAARAGVQTGDVIVSLDGRPLRDASDLRASVAAKGAGAQARLGVLRGGRQLDLEVTLDARPEQVASLAPGGSRGQVSGSSKLNGVSVSAAPAGADQGATGQPAEGGVVVTNVDPTSAAATAGLREGDLIVQVNRDQIRTPEEFQRSASGANDQVLLRIIRGGHPLFLAWQ